jgi:hypothetical protein
MELVAAMTTNMIVPATAAILYSEQKKNLLALLYVVRSKNIRRFYTLLALYTNNSISMYS